MNKLIKLYNDEENRGKQTYVFEEPIEPVRYGLQLDPITTILLLPFLPFIFFIQLMYDLQYSRQQYKRSTTIFQIVRDQQGRIVEIVEHTIVK